MPLLPTYHIPPDIRQDIQMTASEAHLSTPGDFQEHLPVPEIRRSSPSPVSTRSPSPAPPQDGLHLVTERPESSASTASSTTLSGGAASPLGTDPPYNTVLGGKLVEEPESIPVEPVKKHGDVWLAPTPVSYIANMRYSRREKLDFNTMKVIETIPPINAIDFRPDTLGRFGWKPYEHPEGSIYFRYENFYTNLWLYDEADLEAIERAVKKIQEELASHPRLLHDNLEFCIDLIDDPGDAEESDDPEDAKESHDPKKDARESDKLGCYYVVDTNREEAFWLHEIDSTFFCDDADLPVISREHLGYGARMGYWDHCYMFPHGRSVPAKTVGHLRAILSYQMFDRETSKSSTAPYSSNDAHRLIQILKEIEGSKSPDEHAHPEHMIIVARTHVTLLREKLIRFHGERYAQLDSDRSVYGEEHKDRSGLFTAFSWFFFLTPHIYYERLSKVWVDNKVNYEHWRNFITELQEDWAASITPSTIVLSANVGFLAIQSVDLGGQALPNRSMGQIVSYLSTLLSIGNIIACTILSGQHRPSTHRYSDNAVSYLCGRALSTGGIEKLAVIFSIPAAFFLWGLLTFFVAMFWVCVHDTSSVTRIAVSAVAAISLLLLIAIIQNSDWKSQPSINSLATKMRRMQKLVKRAPGTVATRLKSFSRSFTLLSPRLTLQSPRLRKTRYPSGCEDPTSYVRDLPLRALPQGDVAV